MDWLAGKRLAVFSIREGRGGTLWLRAGTAFVNRDGSLNVVLDVLPMDGKLHVREITDKKDGGAPLSGPGLETQSLPLGRRALPAAPPAPEAARAIDP